MQLFTEEILQMLFDEAGMDFTEWAEESQYTSDMSDQTIYSLLPADVISLLGEFGLNASWMHGGM